MRALSIFLAFFVISCATEPQKRFTVPADWTMFQTKYDLQELFEEAYSPDMQWALMKNDRSAYIVVKSDAYPIEISGEQLNDAISRFLESAFEKKRMVFDIYDYTYSIIDGAVLRGEKLVAVEKLRSVDDGVEADMISNILFYQYGGKSYFTFVSMVSLPDVTAENIPILEQITDSL
jgi:hypothetical protein